MDIKDEQQQSMVVIIRIRYHKFVHKNASKIIAIFGIIE
jgi:hypothetical protein